MLYVHGILELFGITPVEAISSLIRTSIINTLFSFMNSFNFS